MYIARILYPVEVLGRGKRIGIWFCGCPHQCPSCSNPELWQTQEKYKTDLPVVRRLIDSIASHGRIDGFTVTGGEPFLRPSDLADLTGYLKTIAPDILVYTGYRYAQLDKSNPHIAAALADIAVLIDGRYEEDKNDGSVLVGSSNQNIIFLKPRYERLYRACMQGGNKIQNFSAGNSIISVGIHARDFERELKAKLSNKNLEEIK